MKEDLENLSKVPEAQYLAKLQAQMQRAGQNVNADGSFELGWGMFVFCMSLGPYFTAIMPKSIWASWWTSWIGYLPLLCGAFAPYAIPKMIKKFITWPRTGYVANPYDVKFIQLVKLMVFGLALGGALGLAVVMVPEILEAINRPGAHGDWYNIMWQGIKLLVYATLAVYLGRKVITKRQPLAGAYDAAVIKQGLGQTVVGKQCLRTVKFTMVLIFVGVPLLVGGVVFGLMYLGKSALRHTGLHGFELGMVSILVGTNAILYLMGNGAQIKQHKWKWLALAALLIVPVILSPLIPRPAVKPEMTPIFESFPPVTLSMSGVWLLSGVITLALFIRRNPPPAPETT